MSVPATAARLRDHDDQRRHAEAPGNEVTDGADGDGRSRRSPGPPYLRGVNSQQTPCPIAPTRATATKARSGAYDAYARLPRRRPHRRQYSHLCQAGRTGLEAGQSHAEQVPDGEPGTDASDDARGVQERVDQPGADHDRESGEGVLRGAHDANPGQQHDDASSDHARGIQLQLGGRGGDHDDRGDEAPCHLLVEGRDSVPWQEQLGPVDRAGRRRTRAGRRSDCHPG